MSAPVPAVGDSYVKSITFSVSAVDVPNAQATLIDPDTGRTRTVGFVALDNNFQKVLPPVVSFGVGETVREVASGKLFSIGLDGYYDHAAGAYVRSEAVFTSASYSKVAL